MLQGLTDRVNQTALADKDPEAERYLQDTLGRNPDALYILAQTVLVQQYALDQAKKQLADARNNQAQQQPQKHTSFLGNLLGLNDPPPPPPQPQYAPAPNYPPPPQQYGNPYANQYATPQYGAPPQQGGFLRSAMQTATGVAAGALAFEGIESLMHGFGQHAGYGGGSSLGGFGDGNRPEVINNYYGDSAHHDGLSPDIEDRRNDNFQFNEHEKDSNALDNSGTSDSFADTGSDDTTYDDSDSLSDDTSGDNFTGSDDSSSSDDSSF